MARRKPSARVRVEVTAAGQSLEEQLVYWYARLRKGKVVNCKASAEEHAEPEVHWRMQGKEGKPILRDKQAGEECARQVAMALGRREYAYECPRSKSGHYHVADGGGGRARRQ